MSKKVIILKESELIELISSAVKKITVKEQRIGMDVMIDAQMKRDFGFNSRGESTTKTVSSGGSVGGWYHYVIDALSIIAYIACPFTLGVGCALSVVFDVINALFYIYDDEDYFMAAMQMAFSIVPGGEFLKYAAKPIAKPMNIMIKTIYRLAVKGVSDSQITKIARKTLNGLTPAQLKEVKSIFPKSTIAQLRSGLVEYTKIVKPYFYISGVEKAWNICTSIVRALIIFADMVWFDPEFSGSILKFLGDWSGFETLTSWGDAMKDWKKRGVIYANNFYRWSGIGGIKALVQTNVSDCNNTVYEWDYVWSEWLATNAIETENPTAYVDEILMDELEEAWWKGWRPNPSETGGKSAPRDNTSEEAQKELQYASLYLMMTSCESFTTKLNIQDPDNTIVDSLGSCSTFISYYDSLSDDDKWSVMSKFLELCPDVN